MHQIMKLFGKLLFRKSQKAKTPHHLALGTTHPKDKPIKSIRQQDFAYGTQPKVTMSDLVDYYDTCYLFGAAVDIHSYLAVGNSFSLAANPDDDMDGDMAQEIIDKMNHICDDKHLDEINLEIAIAMFMAGNCFITPVQIVQDNKDENVQISGFRIIPLSSMVGIHEDWDGTVLGYSQSTSIASVGANSIPIGDVNQIDPADLLHFSIHNTNGSVWGTGIGQRAARKGKGYNRPAQNEKAYRPSLFEMLEMIDDVSAKIYYGGQPRFMATLEDGDEQLVEDTRDMLEALEPLEHGVINGKGEMKTIGLDTQSRFADILSHIRDNAVMCFLNPNHPLWTSRSFSYASSQTAMEGMMPMIKGYERDHKRFLERNFLKPIVDAIYGEDIWDKLHLELHWEETVQFKTKQLKDILPVFESALMKRWIKHEDMFEIIQKLGWSLTPKDDDELEPMPDFTPADKDDEKDIETTNDGDDPGQSEAAEMARIKRKQLELARTKAEQQRVQSQIKAFDAITEHMQQRKGGNHT